MIRWLRPGAQLDYYQAVIDKMGPSKVDAFARLFVMPQTGHGLERQQLRGDGDGKTVSTPSPSRTPSTGSRLLADWVEKSVAPGKSVIGHGGERSLPIVFLPVIP